MTEPVFERWGADSSPVGEPLRLTVRPKPPEPTSEGPVFERWGSPLDNAIETGKGLYNALDAGVASGVAGLVGLPEAAASLGAKGIGKATEAISGWLGQDYQQPAVPYSPLKGILPTTEEAKTAIQNRFYEGQAPYQPQNRAERYTQKFGEFLPGVIGPGGPIRNIVNFAAVPAVTTEAIKEAGGNEWAQGGGGVASSLAAAVLNRGRAPAQTLGRAVTPGVDQAVYDQAQQLVNDAAARGVRLTVPEAMEQIQPGSATGLLNLMRIAESHPESRGTMAQVFAERPQQVEGAARETFDTIAPRAVQPGMIGPQAAEAAEASLNQLRGAINAATRPNYDAARQSLVPQNVHTAMTADPLFAQALHQLRNNPELAGPYAGLSDRSAIVYDGVKKLLEQRAQNLRSPVNPNASQEAASNVGAMAGDARNIAVLADRNAMGLAPNAPGVGNLERALAEQARLRETYLTPRHQGAIGRLASSPDTKAAVEALFGTKSKLSGSEQEITEAVRVLHARAPGVAPDLIRQHVEMTFNKATKNLIPGENQYGGAKFASAIVGDSQDALNLQAAIRASGPHGNQVWEGFRGLLDTLEATGKRQRAGSLTAFNAADLKNATQGGLVTEGAKAVVAPGRILTKLGDVWDTWQAGRNVDQMARILTDPRAAGYLRRIATLPRGSNEAAVVAARLLGNAWISSQAPDKAK